MSSSVNRFFFTVLVFLFFFGFFYQAGHLIISIGAIVAVALVIWLIVRLISKKR